MQVINGQASLVLAALVSGAAAGNVVPGRGDSFILPILPDTQIYLWNCLGYRIQIMETMVEFVASLDPPYVHQVGDLVNNPSNGCEWIAADAIMAMLEDVEVSWGISVGNHEGCFPSPYWDCEEEYLLNPLVNFDSWFPPTRWDDDPVFAGSMDPETMHHAHHLFSAGGVDWLVVNLGFWQPPPPEALAWADGLIKAHPDRHVIIGQHSLIWGSGEWTSEGQVTWDALRENENVKLMLCGHRIDNEHGHRVDLFEDRQVHTIMINYQDWEDANGWNGGDGYLHLAAVSHQGRRAAFTTWSPWLQQHSPHPRGEFTINLGNPGDVTTDGVVNVLDMLAVIYAWGSCPGCIEDTDLSMAVGVDDLLLILQSW